MECECGSRVFSGMSQITRDQTLPPGMGVAIVHVISYRCANCGASHYYIGARTLDEDHVGTWVLVEGQPDSTYEAFQAILCTAKEDQRGEREHDCAEEGSEMVVKFQPSFLIDVPPRIMTSSWGLLFADIMRDLGSRPDIADEVEWNRLVLRGFWAKNPGTGFVAAKMREADSVEEAVEIFADWMVSPEMPAADTISRKLREAKNYLRGRGELARGDMQE